MKPISKITPMSGIHVITSGLQPYQLEPLLNSFESKKMLIIDVRNDDYADRCLPGSEHIPFPWTLDQKKELHQRLLHNGYVHSLTFYSMYEYVHVFILH